MRRNFTTDYSEEMDETAYITGNPHSDTGGSEIDFGLLDEVWQYAWDEMVGSVAAEDITDRGITVGREHPFDRMILHYMQSHFPSYPDAIASGIDFNSFTTEWHSV